MTFAFAAAVDAMPERVPLGSTRLVSTSGEVRPLAVYAGRPVVLFYEDKDSASLNEPLKLALLDADGHPTAAAAGVHLLAVANVSAFDFFPARGIATRKLRNLEETRHMPILIDWHGDLSRPPWNLPANDSTVVILDAQGQTVFRRSGRLDANARAEVLATVRELVGNDGAR